MDIYSLHISVLASLVSLTFGVWLYQFSGRVRRILPSHSEAWKSIALIFMFSSWMPTANCAWVAAREVDVLEQESRKEVVQPSQATQIATADRPAWTLKTDTAKLLVEEFHARTRD